MFIEQFVSQLPLFVLTAFGGAWVIVVVCLHHVPLVESATHGSSP